MEKAAVIPKLEDLAFEVSFKEILGNLILCHEYLPEGKKLPWLPFSSFLTSIPLPSSEDMLSLVKARLDHFLVGTMSDKIREKYVKRFYNSFLDPGNQKNMIDIWVFLSVVLDEHFLELETHVAFPGSKPNPKLISSIAENSPLLKNLKLNFKLMKDFSTQQIKPLMLPMRSLEHLTNLTLSFLSNQIRTTVLSLIGSSCPKLTHLTVSGFRFGKKDVLAIMFGEKIDELFPIHLGDIEWFNAFVFDEERFPNYLEEPEWFHDEELELLEVSSEYLTPLCLTLQALTFDWIEDDDTTNYPGPSVWAFLLRYLPSLQTLEVWNDRVRLEVMLSWAIKLLYLVEQTRMKTKFEKECQRAVERLDNVPPRKLNLRQNLTSSFPGCCASITKIDRVNVLDKVLLQAIGSFCPSLKEICFYESAYHHDSSADLENIEIDASTGEIASILKGWTMKVEVVNCEDVSSESVESILKVLGPELLVFKWCTSDQYSRSFNLESLLPCRQLVTVYLFGCLFNPNKPSTIDITTFLPDLKDFRCSTCLGSWSSVIENKSLRSLAVNCCHLFGKSTGTNGPHPKRFKAEANCISDWSKIPQLWGPQMTHLKISNCTGLTMTSLFNLIPKFEKLKEVSLPDAIKMNESTLMENLSQKMPLIKFTFTKPSSEKCLFLDPK